SARTMPSQSFARVLAGRAKLFAWKDSRDVFRSRAAHCFAPTQVIQFLGSGGVDGRAGAMNLNRADLAF
ncbi:MAG: hypothetical protein ACYC60_13280, partial [Thermoanaerobaculia bacterium]